MQLKLVRELSFQSMLFQKNEIFILETSLGILIMFIENNEKRVPKWANIDLKLLQG